MFKKTVKYKDFNGVEKVEDVYFHMMAPDFADLEFNATFEDHGGLSDYIKSAMSSGNGQKIYTFFKLMIVNSYGKRSDDGATFLKRPEYTEEFLNSPAYEEFFLWLVENPKNAEDFWNAITPEALLKQANEIQSQQEVGQKKITELSREELLELIQKKVAAPAIASPLA